MKIGKKKWMNGQKKMLDGIKIVCDMFCQGVGWEKNTLWNLMEYAPHLLAPTGTNLDKYHNLGDIMAGFHYDLNFMTIHGKSQFPGLFAWLRDGTKFPVKVPDGHLLLQAAKQFEWITGGYVMAGFHEVICSKETLEAYEKAKNQNKCVWRISTTLFGHISSDYMLKPMKQFATKETLEKYPEILAGDQVMEELKQIKLSRE